MGRLAGYRAGILILPNAKTFLNIPELSAHVTGKMIIKFRTNVTTQPRVSSVFLRAITCANISVVPLSRHRVFQVTSPGTGCSRWPISPAPETPLHLKHLKGPRLQWMRKGVKTFIVVFLQSHSRCKWIITLVTIKQAHKPRSSFHYMLGYFWAGLATNKETNLHFYFLDPGDETGWEGWAEVAKNKEHQRRLQLRQLENSREKKETFLLWVVFPAAGSWPAGLPS